MPKSRLAPTPSGFLHTGNAFNFLLTEQIVRASNGVLRLRIDDLDTPRMRPEFLEDIFETLRWLGISWQEGPQDAAEQIAAFSPQSRVLRYDELIDQLAAAGKVFACSCSRKAVESASPDGQYPGTCIARKLPLDTPNAALRIFTPKDAEIVFDDALLGPVRINLHQQNRHFIIRRRDGIPAYHLASLTDDLDFGISHIVRGKDLLESTAAQLYLSRELGGTDFDAVRFCHHPLLKDEAGGKLSKSAGSSSLKALRAAGWSADELRAMFAAWRKELGLHDLPDGDFI